jgi:4-hydroxybenzoate polyprenyltransferase
MWIVFERLPRPDANIWPGRRSLAIVDAIVWPALVIAVFAFAPFDAGIVSGLVVVAAALMMSARVQRAVIENQRYRFTTWRIGVLVGGLMLIGLVAKLLA